MIDNHIFLVDSFLVAVLAISASLLVAADAVTELVRDIVVARALVVYVVAVGSALLTPNFTRSTVLSAGVYRGSDVTDAPVRLHVYVTVYTPLRHQGLQGP